MATPGARTAVGKDIQSNDALVPPLRRLGLYERSVLLRAQRERKMKALRSKLLEDCTFSPRTNNHNNHHKISPHRSHEGPPSSSPASTASSSRFTAQTSPSSGTTVWERLYSQHHHHQQPSSSNRSAATSSSHRSRPGTTTTPVPSFRTSSPGTAVQTTTSAAAAAAANTTSSPLTPMPRRQTTNILPTSARLEQLYEEGVRKLRRRAATDKMETEWRQRRWEDLQLEQARDTQWLPPKEGTRSYATAGTSAVRTSHLVMRPVVPSSSSFQAVVIPPVPLRRPPRMTTKTILQPVEAPVPPLPPRAGPRNEKGEPPTAPPRGRSREPPSSSHRRDTRVRTRCPPPHHHHLRHHRCDDSPSPPSIPSEIWIRHPRRQRPPDTASPMAGAVDQPPAIGPWYEFRTPPPPSTARPTTPDRRSSLVLVTTVATHDRAPEAVASNEQSYIRTPSERHGRRRRRRIRRSSTSGSSSSNSSSSPAHTDDSVIWEQSTEYASV